MGLLAYMSVSGNLLVFQYSMRLLFVCQFKQRRRLTSPEKKVHCLKEMRPSPEADLVPQELLCMSASKAGGISLWFESIGRILERLTSHQLSERGQCSTSVSKPVHKNAAQESCAKG